MWRLFVGRSLCGPHITGSVQIWPSSTKNLSTLVLRKKIKFNFIQFIYTIVQSVRLYRFSLISLMKLCFEKREKKRKCSKFKLETTHVIKFIYFLMQKTAGRFENSKQSLNNFFQNLVPAWLKTKSLTFYFWLKQIMSF